MGFCGRRRSVLAAAVAFVTFAVLLDAVSARAAVDYDIVYVRQPRFGDNTNTTWPEVAHPAQHRSRRRPHAAASRRQRGGAGRRRRRRGHRSVRLLRRAVGLLQLLLRRPPAGATTRSAACPTAAPTSSASTSRPAQIAAAHLRRVHAQHRRRPLRRVEPGQSRPAGYDYLGYGILNLGPAPLAGGKIAFTSNRNGFVPPHGLTNPTLQLFVMDEDGAQRDADRADEHRQRAAPDAARATAACCSARSRRRACATAACGASGRSGPTAATGSRW